MIDAPRTRCGALRLLTTTVLLALATGCATPPEEAPPALPRPLATPVPLPEPAPPVALLPANEVAAVAAAAPSARTRLDPGSDAERGDLWLRLRGGFAMSDLDNELVRKWEQWYAKDPAYVQRMTERGGRYLFHIVEEVARRGMPMELALLPFIESAFNPQAESRARASGMWQFMPATGKDFELRQNLFRDDRRDVLASTRAALDYLQRLHKMFDDWPLALAAYNWGQGNVSKALERNRRNGEPTSYEYLRMPQETREYVPKLQAVKNIVMAPRAYGLALAPLENHPFFLTVPIERDIDVALAARLSGLSVDAFQQLNPQMNKPVILAAGTPRVLLPYDNANHFLRELALHRGAQASWTAWVAPRTLKPAEAAQLVGMSESELSEVNRIPPRMLVKAGSTLLVPRRAHTTADVTEHVADTAALALSPEARPLRKLSFKAGRQGESVVAVAKRYKLSAAQVAAWNGVSASSHFKAGQTIVVKLPASTMSAKAPAATTRLASAPAVKSNKSGKSGKATKSAQAHRPAPAARVRVAQRANSNT